MSNGRRFSDRVMSMFIPLYLIGVVIIAGILVIATISGADPEIIRAAITN